MNRQKIKPLRIRLFFTVLLFYIIPAINAQNLFPSFQAPVKYPAITPDGNYMVFIADDGTTAAACESFFRDGKWTEPQKFDYINQLIKKTGHEIGGFNFNHDGSMLLFHANMSGNYDIFYAQKIKGQWSEPINFGAPVNSGDDEFSPTISSNLKTIFVLRNSPTKRNESCKKMFMFETDKDGKWTGPAYLSAEFNTGCQETPFIAADNVTFYFSSMREDVKQDGKKTDPHIFNIYSAKRLSKDVWMLPAYLEELNTKNNNLSPIMNASGDYFVYNVKAPKIKNQPQNIIKEELPLHKKPNAMHVISGVITDFYTKEPLIADVIVYDAITSVEKGRFKSTDDGKYSIILTYFDNYKIDFTSDGYSHTYLFKDLMASEENGKDVFNTSLYQAINLELNIYDSELFYPLSPKVSVFDSISGRPVLLDMKPVSDGKYKCRLNIGQNYRINFEDDILDTYDTYFDLRTPVFYSDFEKSIELKATRKLVVLDLPGVDLRETTFTAKNLNRNELITEVVQDSKGRYVMSLRIGDTYEIDVTKTGYTFFNTTIDADTSEEETVAIHIEELTTETKLVLNNITFETNSAELNATSYEELGRVTKLMTENPEILLEIAAHTDDVGANAFNMLLSNRRAQSVVDYLISRGIPASRLKSKGYGKSQPLAPNNSPENRALNRRVEMRVIGD